jgi:hypothetical protein
MGRTCVEKLTSSPPGFTTGTSTGNTKSYLQPFRNSDNKTKIRNMLCFFIIFILKVDTKKGFSS